MATVNLLPDTDVSNDWTLSTGSDVYALIDDDHSGFITADGSHLSATASGRKFTVGFQNFTEAHSSIDGVQLVTRAGNNGRGASFNLETELLPTLGSAYYTETSGTQAASATYRTQTYTNRTTYDGSNAWNNIRVDGLKASVELAIHSGGTSRLTYAYVIVTYTEPLATDNAIFFGTNF